MDASFGTSRLLPPVWFLGAIVLMVLLDQLLPLMVWLERPWVWLGALPALVGIALATWAERLFKRAGTGVRPLSPASAVVTRGPYRVTRNPMYLGMVLVLAGLAIVLGSVAPLLVIPPFVWILQQRFILPEEAHMERQQGEAYAAYRARVRRWV